MAAAVLVNRIGCKIGMADIETGNVLARYLADDASYPMRRIWGHVHRLNKAI